MPPPLVRLPLLLLRALGWDSPALSIATTVPFAELSLVSADWCWPQDYAEQRPRIKGRFVSPAEYAAWRAEQEGGGGGGRAGSGAQRAQQRDQVVPTSRRR